MPRVRARATVPWAVAVVLLVAAACNQATYTDRRWCQGDGCTCEEDPDQLLCRGFNDRPDGGLVWPDSGRGDDAAADAGGEAGDGGDRGNGGEDGDAGGDAS